MKVKTSVEDFVFWPAKNQEIGRKIHVQIARLRLNDDNWVYGSSKLSEKVAIAVNPNNGKLIRFSFADKQYRENVEILECSNDYPVEDILSTSWPYPKFPPIYGGKKNNLIDVKESPPKTITLPAPTTILLTKPTLIPPVLEQITTTRIPTTIKPQQLTNKGELQETDYIELSGAGINWSLDKEFVERNEGNGNNSITNKLWREDSNILTTNHQNHQHRRKRFKMKSDRNIKKIFERNFKTIV
uniref:Uncharacterized protein n=1 Tax=Meloidogyne incognita TaxID=6306 RepID=A0A914M9N2_MELIC